MKSHRVVCYFHQKSHVFRENPHSGRANLRLVSFLWSVRINLCNNKCTLQVFFDGGSARCKETEFRTSSCTTSEPNDRSDVAFYGPREVVLQPLSSIGKDSFVFCNNLYIKGMLVERNKLSFCVRCLAVACPFLRRCMPKHSAIQAYRGVVANWYLTPAPDSFTSGTHRTFAHSQARTFLDSGYKQSKAWFTSCLFYRVNRIM